MDNLLFFNKDGYPCNFSYDESSTRWTGKMIFDENSTDTYKTLGLYILQSVEPIIFSATTNFVGVEVADYSGMTFHAEGVQGASVGSVAAVNADPSFRSKWVYGDAYHTQFPRGTAVEFSGVTGATADFSPDHPYVVVSTKPGAILVITETANNIFDATSFNVSSGTTSAVGVTHVYDYDGSATTIVSTLDPGRKITVHEAGANDGTYELLSSGTTLFYSVDYQLSGTTGDTLQVVLELLTERPRLYLGSVSVAGTGVTLVSGMNSNFPFGTEFVLENLTGGTFVNSNVYTVVSSTTGETAHTGTTNFSEVEVFSASDLLYWRNKIRSSPTWLAETQDKADASGVTLDEMLDSESLRLEMVYGNYEIKYYATVTGMTSGAISPGDTVRLSGLTSLANRGDFYVLEVSEGGSTTTLRFQQRVREEISTYTITRIIPEHERTQLQCTVTGTPFTATGTVIAYSTSNRVTLTQDYLSGSTVSGEEKTSYQNTIDALNNRYTSTLSDSGVMVYLRDGDLMMVESTHPSDTVYLATSGRTDGVDLVSGTISTGPTAVVRMTLDGLPSSSRYTYETGRCLSPYTLTVTGIHLIEDLSGYGISLGINGATYYGPLAGSGSTCTEDTLSLFYTTYVSPLSGIGFVLTTGTTSLTVSSTHPLVPITDYSFRTNPYSDSGTTYLSGQTGPVLTSTWLQLTGISLYDAGVSTGMVIDVSGSTYPFNNGAYAIVGLTDTEIEVVGSGPFFDEPTAQILFSTREYVRRPRESYTKDIRYRFSWVSPSDPAIFLYDLSGDNIEPYMGNSGLTYVGPTPLVSESRPTARLNTEPNRDFSKVADPDAQQTVFDDLEFELEKLADDGTFDPDPVPIQVFLGFGSDSEGVSSAVLKVDRVEDLVLTGTTGIALEYFDFEDDTVLYDGFNVNFTSLGFEAGQIVSLRFVDTSETGQTIFPHYGEYTLSSVTRYRLVLSGATMTEFSTSGKTWQYRIRVEPKEIARFSIFGETEMEDTRFSDNLRNLGAHLDRDDTPIFRTADVNDDGIDYRLLNRKRKELLNVHTEIFNYVGAYKAILNAVNFFGYNDLELHEYFRDINPDSGRYGLLRRVRVPNPFSSDADWKESDDVSQSANYKKTSLFSLVYPITDYQGNPVDTYSVEEAQLKLNKLKSWLRRRVVPVSSNIRDITGESSSMGTNYLFQDTSVLAQKTVIQRTSAVVNFNYTATLNFGTSYSLQVNFYTGFTNVAAEADPVDYFDCRIRTYSLGSDGATLIPQQNINLYKTDLNTYAFTADKAVDPFVYIETTNYGDDGVGMTNHVLFRYDERKNYTLVHNVFHGGVYTPFVTDGAAFYLIDGDGNFYIVEA